MTLKVDTQRLTRELARFTRNLGPAAIDQAVRATTFHVGGDIVRSLNGTEAGFPVPKRIDTNRYRAGWVMGTAMVAPPAQDTTTGGDADNPQQPDDGVGETIRRSAGLNLALKVTNNVEYGPYIEDGTDTMAPGHHVKLSLLRGVVRLREALGKEIPAAWKNQVLHGFGP
ncbi:MAG: hypothetical protein ACEQSX_15540 [Baekduiaceae bacterium]